MHAVSQRSQDISGQMPENRRLHSFERSGLEPIAAVGDPPGGVEDGDGGGAGPPEWQQDIGQKPEQHEDRPEYLSLHESDCR